MSKITLDPEKLQFSDKTMRKIKEIRLKLSEKRTHVL
jgi:hypothetical protein